MEKMNINMLLLDEREKFGKCLNRQVHEDIRMQKFVSKGGTLLNSKNEYFTPKSVQAIFKQWRWPSTVKLVFQNDSNNI